jgi:hypothetical protein
VLRGGVHRLPIPMHFYSDAIETGMKMMALAWATA